MVLVVESTALTSELIEGDNYTARGLVVTAGKSPAGSVDMALRSYNVELISEIRSRAKKYAEKFQAGHFLDEFCGALEEFLPTVVPN